MDKNNKIIKIDKSKFVTNYYDQTTMSNRKSV